MLSWLSIVANTHRLRAPGIRLATSHTITSLDLQATKQSQFAWVSNCLLHATEGRRNLQTMSMPVQISHRLFEQWVEGKHPQTERLWYRWG